MTYATMEEALSAICTHICRQDPHLKLNPRHCELRKAKSKLRLAGGNPMDAGFNAYSICKDCKGPVKPGEVVQKVSIIVKPVKAEPAEVKMKICKAHAGDLCRLHSRTTTHVKIWTGCTTHARSVCGKNRSSGTGGREMWSTRCTACPRVMTERERLEREIIVQQRIDALQVLNGLVRIMETSQVGALIAEAREILRRAEKLPAIGLGEK